MTSISPDAARTKRPGPALATGEPSGSCVTRGRALRPAQSTAPRQDACGSPRTPPAADPVSSRGLHRHPSPRSPCDSRCSRGPAPGECRGPPVRTRGRRRACGTATATAGPGRRRGGRLVHLVPALVAGRDTTRPAVAPEALAVGDVERDCRMHARRFDVRPRPAPLVCGQRGEGRGAVDEMARVAAAAAGILAVRSDRDLVQAQVARGAQLAGVLVGWRVGQSQDVREHPWLTVRGLVEHRAVHRNDAAHRRHHRPIDPEHDRGVTGRLSASGPGGVEIAGDEVHRHVRPGLVEREGVSAVAGRAADSLGTVGRAEAGHVRVADQAPLGTPGHERQCGRRGDRACEDEAEPQVARAKRRRGRELPRLAAQQRADSAEPESPRAGREEHVWRARSCRPHDA